MSDTETVGVVNTSGEDTAQNDKTKGKKGKANRVSTIDRLKEEGEAILKGLGPVQELEGRRRTRSSARGVPATPPPPVKKERKSGSVSPNKGKGRGRPKKNASNAKDTETDETDSQDEGGRESAPSDSADVKSDDLAGSPHAGPEGGDVAGDVKGSGQNNTAEHGAGESADECEEGAKTAKKSEGTSENGADAGATDKDSEQETDTPDSGTERSLRADSNDVSAKRSGGDAPSSPVQSDPKDSD